MYVPVGEISLEEVFGEEEGLCKRREPNLGGEVGAGNLVGAAEGRLGFLPAPTYQHRQENALV